MDAKELEIVGVNCYQDQGASKKIETLKVPPELEAKSVERLRAYKTKRDRVKASASLANLSAGAKGDANLMELIYQCAKSECTLGEIADELRKVFGEHAEYSGF
jgi:methylmalonyl-CoA mutase N-terminal domain/subunit